MNCLRLQPEVGSLGSALAKSDFRLKPGTFKVNLPLKREAIHKTKTMKTNKPRAFRPGAPLPRVPASQKTPRRNKSPLRLQLLLPLNKTFLTQFHELFPDRRKMAAS